MGIFSKFFTGHVCAIYSVASCYRNMWIESDADSMESGGTDDDGFWEFSTFDKTLISITWSLFDIFQYDVSPNLPSIFLSEDNKPIFHLTLFN